MLLKKKKHAQTRWICMPNWENWGKKGEGKREKRVRDWQGERPRLIISSLISRVWLTATIHWRVRRTGLLRRRRWFYDGIRVWKVREGHWIGRTRVMRPMSICWRLMRFWIWWTSYQWGLIPRLWIRLIRQFNMRCLSLGFFILFYFFL